MSFLVAGISWFCFLFMVLTVTFIPKNFWAGHWHPALAMSVFFITAVIASAINADYEVKERR